MALTNAEIDNIAGPADYFDRRVFARAIESAATAPLLARIAELEASANVCGSGAGCLHKDATIAALTAQVEQDNWRQYATERETTAQAVIERHRGEQDSLMNLLKQAREQVEQAAQPSEQAAFKDWLHRVCPSGDVTDVKRQWEASSDLAEWLESQRTEDVLIDGVAYTVPIEVACELLHLHMALLTKPAQAAQPVYQVREAFVDDPAGTWRDTWEGPFYMVPEADRRIVYTSPPKAAPLTDEQIVSMVEGVLTKTAYNYSVAVQIGIRAARAVEQAHGITPATVEKGETP